jgi:Tfp pilus assembly protein PilN
MEAVNLLPHDVRVQKSKSLAVGGSLPGKRTLQFGGIAAALLAVLVAVVFIRERSVVHSRQSDLAATQARIVAVQSQVEAVKNAQATSASHSAVVQSVAASRMNWDRAMGDLARVLPVDVVLTNLTAGAPTTASAAPVGAPAGAASAAAGTGSLAITGVAPSHVRVAAVLDRITLLPWLSGVTLQSSTRQSDGTTQFTVNAGVSEEH